MKNTADRLRALGMTKASFAERTGISESTIYGWKKCPPWVTVLLDAWEEVESLKAGRCSQEAQAIEAIQSALKAYGKHDPQTVRKD
jgi:hypothetical protein